LNKSGKKIKITKYKLSVLANVFSMASDCEGSNLKIEKPHDIFQSSRTSLRKKPQNL